MISKTNPQLLFRQASAFHNKGLLAEAERLYLQVIAAQPFSAVPRHMLGVLRQQQGRDEESLSLLAGALKINPNNPEALASYGNALNNLGRPAEAVANFDRALALKPDFFGAWYNRALLLHEMGRPEESVTSLDKALAIRPDYADAWNNHGNVLRKLKRYQEALASFDRALALKPDFPNALYNRGNVLFLDLKQAEEAVLAYDKALALRPDFTQAWDNRGSVLCSLGRFAQALESYDRALAVSSSYSEAWNNRGNVLQKLGRHKEALASFDRALALKPDFPNAQYNRGNVLFLNLNRTEEAIPSYDKALALRPDFAEAWDNRGSAQCKLGYFTASLTSFDRALAIRPAYAEAWNNRGHVLFELDRIEDGLESFMRGAAITYGPGQNPVAGGQPPPLHKLRHDEEQREYRENAASHRAAKPGALLAGPAVRLGNSAPSEQWRIKKPQIAVIDDFLTKEALESLRRFCLEEPVWRLPYERGYLGGFPEHGFACPLLGQIARGMRTAFPGIFRDLPLRYLWGFKYDSQLAGINIHADEAAVNANFWLTPDESNLDPDGGGLVVWDVAAPLDWDFDRYNRDTDAIRDYLEKSGATSVRIPYRANRAVVFDSDLFHETDTIRFKDGYADRRINVTLLFGHRERDMAPPYES